MKKLLKLGASLLLLGLFFGLIGFWQHGFKSVALVHGRPVVVEHQVVENKVPKFKAITVDSEDYLIRIQSGSNYRVKMTGTKTTLPTVKVVGQTLEVKQNKTGQGYATFDIENSERPTVWITVPNDTALTTIKSRNNSGFSLDHISVDTLDVEAEYSNFKLANTQVKQAIVLRSGSGEVTITDTQLQAPDITIKNGDVDLKNSTLTQGTFRLTSGDLELTDTAFTGIVRVYNENGDVAITGADRDKGYILRNNNGENSLFDQNSDDDDDNDAAMHHNVLTKNPDAADRIEVTNKTGDNTVW